MKKILILMGLLLISPLSYGVEPIDSYVARLGSQDHFNSAGSRLKTVTDIIRQDRANFHKYNIRDSEDQSDSVFGDVKKRERIPLMLGRGYIDKATKTAILNGTPLVLVNIYKNHLEVYLQ